MNGLNIDVDEFNYQAFSDKYDVQKIAKESIEHITKIYPIYIMMRYNGGNALSKEQIQQMDILLDLVNQYDVDITLVLNEQDVQMFHEYDSGNCFKYLVHSCYDSANDLSNNNAKIKNFILKSAASRFGNKNISWIFLIEEGVKFNKYSQNKFVPCNTVEDNLLAIAIWQYIATKKIYASIKDENGIGLAGIGSNSSLEEHGNIFIDKMLFNSALLINLSECNRKHIEFDLMHDILEDDDFNVNMFANGLHIVGLNWPITIQQSLTEYRTDRKLSNLAISIWEKWGDKIVKNLIVKENKIIPIFVSDFSEIIKEFNASSRHRIVWPKNERLMAEYLAQKKKIHKT